MLKLYTGFYVGDGTAGRLITTGASGAIKRVSVYPLAGVVPTSTRIDSMPVAVSAQSTGGINVGGLDTQGNNFVVSDFAGININTPILTYCWEVLAE